MEARIKDLLKKIKFPEDKFSCFENTTLKKIVVIEDKNTWNIYLKNNTNFEYEEISIFLRSLEDFVQNKYKYNLIIEAEKENLNLYEDYYKNILILINHNNLYYNMFCDRLIKDDEDNFLIEVYNKSEEITLKRRLKEITTHFKNFGFTTMPKIVLNSEKEASVKEEITKEITIDLEKVKNIKIEEKVDIKKEKPKRFKKELFTKVNGNKTDLADINYEINDVVIEADIFGIEPSQKKEFKSVTLKVTDYTTSMYVRVFANTDEEYSEILSTLKEGQSIRVSGYVKNNNYYNDFIVNARNIEILDKEKTEIMDTEEEKRVELHAHTMGSQMDGVIPVDKLIKNAIKWGHKAIAITDHNAIQTFPAAAKFKKDIKVLFGVELAMIDDDLDLIFREDDSNLLDNTYVVFDFETTGFNAGGGDSIIEVGAVKLHNGEIIDTYDKFVNPGRPIPEHITRITSITDEMVKDADDE